MPDLTLEPALAACPPQFWRVGRQADPLAFSEIQAEDAALVGAGNRFDVPGGEVLYAASNAEGAFTETTSRFRPTAAMRAMKPEPDEHLMAVGGMTAEWRNRRRLACFTAQDALPFLDVDDPQTHTFLTAQMATTLKGLKVENLDIATLRGPNRLLTRAIAEWAFTAVDEDDEFMFSGLRYQSRLGPYECWAIFGGTQIELLESLPIGKGSVALQTVAKQFDLTIH